MLHYIGYDGPLQYSMTHDNNPDQVISIVPTIECIEGNLFLYFCLLLLNFFSCFPVYNKLLFLIW